MRERPPPRASTHTLLPPPARCPPLCHTHDAYRCCVAVLLARVRYGVGTLVAIVVLMMFCFGGMITYYHVTTKQTEALRRNITVGRQPLAATTLGPDIAPSADGYMDIEPAVSSYNAAEPHAEESQLSAELATATTNPFAGPKAAPANVAAPPVAEDTAPATEATTNPFAALKSEDTTPAAVHEKHRPKSHHEHKMHGHSDHRPAPHNHAAHPQAEHHVNPHHPGHGRT